MRIFKAASVVTDDYDFLCPYKEKWCDINKEGVKIGDEVSCSRCGKTHKIKAIQDIFVDDIYQHSRLTVDG